MFFPSIRQQEALQKIEAEICGKAGGHCPFFSGSLPFVTPESSLSVSRLLYFFSMLWPYPGPRCRFFLLPCWMLN